MCCKDVMLLQSLIHIPSLFKHFTVTFSLSPYFSLPFTPLPCILCSPSPLMHSPYPHWPPTLTNTLPLPSPTHYLPSPAHSPSPHRHTPPPLTRTLPLPSLPHSPLLPSPAHSPPLTSTLPSPHQHTPLSSPTHSPPLTGTLPSPPSQFPSLALLQMCLWVSNLYFTVAA